MNEEINQNSENGIKQRWITRINELMSYADLFREQFQQQLAVWRSLATLALTFAASALACGLFIFVFEPLSSVLIESRSLRYKMQGYFSHIVEKLVEIKFSQAFELEVSGDEQINPENLAVVISNHQGAIDYFTLMNFASRSELDNSIFFFVWKHCVRLPSVQVLYNAWRNKSNWKVPKRVLSDVFCSVLESPWRDQGGKWIVIFPEVIPWSNTAMLEHRAECSNNGCPKLQNLLYPRFNAFNQTVSFLRDHPLADVYDLAILYINNREGKKFGVPTWKDLVFSQKDWTVKIVVKRIPTTQVPYKEKHMTRWLEKQWFTKDQEISLLKKKSDQDKNNVVAESQKSDEHIPKAS